MEIYRGLKDILFHHIDPFYKNGADHTYGEGTSYALDRSLAEEYCNSIIVKNYGWILKYNFQPKNPFYVSEKNFVDLENFGESTDMFYNNKIISSQELAQLVLRDGYDSIIFDYDENDSHVMILRDDVQLELIQIELFTENQLIVDFLQTLEIPNDGTNFIVNSAYLNIIDDFLKKM